MSATDPDLVTALTAQRERVAALPEPVLNRMQSSRERRMADDYARSRLAEALVSLAHDARITAECFESVGMDARTSAGHRRLERLVEQLQTAIADGLLDRLADLPPRTIGTELT